MVQWYLDMLLEEKCKGIESLVFKLIYYVMKPSEPLQFDVEGFDAVNDFLHGTFYLTYINFEKKGIFRRDIQEDSNSNLINK